MTESTSLYQDRHNRSNGKYFKPEIIQPNHVLRQLFLIPAFLFFVFGGHGVVYAGISDDCSEALTPEVRNEDTAQSWWMSRHQEKLEEDGRETAELLFLGDSITQGWERAGSSVWDEHYAHRGAFNLGYSGDRTEHVLWRLQNGEVDDIRPELVILMIGTNNTGHRQDPPECTTRGIEMIVDELKDRLPETRILLLAIFPRGETPEDPLRQLNEEINERISSLADNNHVYFQNINDAFLDEDGHMPEEVMPDMLHPNEHGYSLWAKAMESTLGRLVPE